MKKITSVLIMLFVMFFTINVKAGEYYEIYPTLQKDKDGELYNSMPTEVNKGDIVTVKVILNETMGWTIAHGYEVIHWDQEAFELIEQTGGKYYSIKDENIENVGSDIIGTDKLYLSYDHKDVAAATNTITVAEFKFKVKKDAKEGVYRIEQEMYNDAVGIKISVDETEYINAYGDTLYYQVGKPKITSSYSKNDIVNSSYVIGTHLFTREGSDAYDGTLTTQHIMLASKTIESENTDDMIVYVKNARGVWKNAINDEELGNKVPDTFNINYIDMIANYAENGIYTSNDEKTILRLVQYNSKKAIVTIETDQERIHGVATMSGRVATLSAGGNTYQINITDTSVTITTADTYIVNKTLTKRANLSVNDYYNNAYVSGGIYDGYGTPTHYLKSSQTGKYVSGNNVLYFVRTGAASARICLKTNGSTECVYDRYAHHIEDNVTYTFRFDEIAYGITWTDNQIVMSCVTGSCQAGYLGSYAKDDTYTLSMEEVFGIWEKNEASYKVRIDDDNGNPDDDHILLVPKGMSLNQFDEWTFSPESYEKEGYGFVELRLNGVAYDFDTPVNAPITLVAFYRQVPAAPVLAVGPEGTGHDYYSYANNIFTYKLSITLDGEYDGFDIFDEMDMITPVSGATKGNPAVVELTTDVRKNYVAKAYFLSYGIKQYGTVSNTLQLHAYKEWVSFSQSVTYDGENYVSVVAVPYGEYAPKPQDPVRSGYDFAGWKLNGELFDFENTRINDSILLDATWENSITTPVLTDTQTDDYYQHRLSLSNLNAYCTNANNTCTGLSTDHYSITGFEVFEIVGEDKVIVESTTGERVFAPYQYLEFMATPNTTKQYVARAYKIDGAEWLYSEYSAPFEIDTTLPTPSIAFNTNGGAPDPDTYEAENWVEVTNLMSSFGHQCQITTCDDYKIDQFELYYKDGNDYYALGTFEPTAKMHVSTNFGETVNYYVRGLKYTEGNTSPVYTDYSNVLVFSPTLAAPVISRAHMASSLDDLLFQYDDTKGFEIGLVGDYSVHMVCNPNDSSDCGYVADEYEWFEKNGNDLTTAYDGGLGGEATLYVAEGVNKTFVAKAYVNRPGNPKYYSTESNAITFNLSNPTYTFETVEYPDDNTKVMVKGYINDFGIGFNQITVDTTDIIDYGTASYFVTDATNLENVDTITIKLSDNKSVTATRKTN